MSVSTHFLHVPLCLNVSCKGGARGRVSEVAHHCLCSVLFGAHIRKLVHAPCKEGIRGKVAKQMIHFSFAFSKRVNMVSTSAGSTSGQHLQGLEGSCGILGLKGTSNLSSYCPLHLPLTPGQPNDWDSFFKDPVPLLERRLLPVVLFCLYPSTCSVAFAMATATVLGCGSLCLSVFLTLFSSLFYFSLCFFSCCVEHW